jgi:hypothetical protein
LLGVSVRQPWAWAIARGHKKIMSRASGTDYRGLIAIYASFRVDPGSRGKRLLGDGYWDSSDPAAAVGGIVAVATLADVCTAAASAIPAAAATPAASAGTSAALPAAASTGTPAAIPGGPCRCGAWASAGAYHWRIEDPWPLRWPVLAVHGTGLWEVAPAVAAGVVRLLPWEVANCSMATRGAVALAAELDSVNSRTD